MNKEDIIKLITNFDVETWKYPESDKLFEDMDIIYSIGKEVRQNKITNLNSIYDTLLAIMGMIRLKYGFERVLIDSNKELEFLKPLIDQIPINSDDIINQYQQVLSIYNDHVNQIKDTSFIKNNYENKGGKEGLYLTIESLKSLIEIDEYKALLDTNQINEILIDCIKLNNGATNLQKLGNKYKNIIEKIWHNSLTETIQKGKDFRILFSNIYGDTLTHQASLLRQRPIQSSCSLISSNLIATYSTGDRRIGFIYPKDSTLIMASAYDLGSNVFGEGVKNKEKGTSIVTPLALEKIGIKRTKEKGEDLYSSSCYNEVLVSGKPCGIALIGLGENDLNIEYEETQMLAEQMNLQIHYIDTLDYKDTLSESDKYYIAFHSIMSYLGITKEQLVQNNEESISLNNLLYKYIDKYKNQLADTFLTLKKEGRLNKDNMIQSMSNFIDFSELNTKRM